MVLDPDGCFRALRAKDTRFDGVFFAAIKSTGIYCRPVCPARPARRESCVFYDTAAAAALARIEAGALNERSVDDLAAEFGITARHLRRAVESEFGVSPVEVAQT